MKKMSKKFFALLCAGALSVSLMACGQTATESTTETPVDETVAATGEAASYSVAIVKQMDHASLDEIANAIAAQLDAIAAEKQVEITYEIYSGQGEQSVLMQIGNQAVADGVDCIIPIATTAAQVMAVCTEESQIPVVYAAISDPEAAELTGIANVSGTSDMLNTEFIMDMIFAQNPEAAKIGLLYSLSEPNSATPIAEAKAYLDAKGIAYVEATGNTNDEVIQAASILVADGVDAVFTPTDNIIMAAELSIAESFAEAGILHYTGADSFVRNGAFATCGVNYTDLGTKTADLSYAAMTEGMAGLEDYYKMDGGIINVNTETAETAGADYAVFQDMGELVEVITTEE